MKQSFSEQRTRFINSLPFPTDDWSIIKLNEKLDNPDAIKILAVNKCEENMRVEIYSLTENNNSYEIFIETVDTVYWSDPLSFTSSIQYIDDIVG